MEQLVEEFGHATFTPFPVIAARLLLAAIFGAAIGFEREWRNRPAGLRTHVLVCVAEFLDKLFHGPTQLLQFASTRCD